MEIDLDIDEREENMEHNPYISLEDDTEITYSDLQVKPNGEEYITIYFETPTEERGFCSMDVEYPGGAPANVKGYTKEEIDRLRQLHC